MEFSHLDVAEGERRHFQAVPRSCSVKCQDNRLLPLYLFLRACGFFRETAHPLHKLLDFRAL